MLIHIPFATCRLLATWVRSNSAKLWRDPMLSSFLLVFQESRAWPVMISSTLMLALLNHFAPQLQSTAPTSVSTSLVLRSIFFKKKVVIWIHFVIKIRFCRHLLTWSVTPSTQLSQLLLRFSRKLVLMMRRSCLVLQLSMLSELRPSMLGKQMFQ